MNTAAPGHMVRTSFKECLICIVPHVPYLILLTCSSEDRNAPPTCILIAEAASSSYKILQFGGQGSCTGKQEKGGKAGCSRSPENFSYYGDIFHTGTSSRLLHLYKEDTVESRMDEVRLPHVERNRLEREGLKTKDSVLGRSVG